MLVASLLFCSNRQKIAKPLSSRGKKLAREVSVAVTVTVAVEIIEALPLLTPLEWVPHHLHNQQRRYH